MFKFGFFSLFVSLFCDAETVIWGS